MQIINSLTQEHLFKDKNGHIVIWQWPNIPLYGWIVSRLLVLIVTSSQLKHGVAQVSMAFLAIWAILEIVSGVNYFRRLLGLIVLVSIVMNFVK